MRQTALRDIHSSTPSTHTGDIYISRWISRQNSEIKDRAAASKVAFKARFRWMRQSIGIGMVAALLIARPSVGKERGARGSVDANVVVRKMIITYQGAQAFEETSEAKIKGTGKQDYIQATTLRFKRPNLIYLSSEDPSIGTYQSFCNGKVITVYTGVKNVYTKRNSPTNLRQTMTTLSSTGQSLIGIPIVQMLSPTSFVTAKGMPDECKNFRFVRMDVLDGNKVAVVTGQASDDWLMTVGVPKQTMFDRREITLWVDTSQYLLRKASCDLRWHATVAATPTRPASTILGSLKFEEIHRASRINPPLRDEDFVFIAPKGAAERFQDRK